MSSSCLCGVSLSPEGQNELWWEAGSVAPERHHMGATEVGRGICLSMVSVRLAWLSKVENLEPPGWSGPYGKTACLLSSFDKRSVSLL